MARDSAIKDIRIDSSIPVLRMLDETLAKKFYLEFLGYEVDWEHRFGDSSSSPLYMQIHLGDSVIHLNGHANDESPVAEVRIPVHGIVAFCELLRSRSGDGEKPSIVDPRFEGKPSDLNLRDPFGNMLVFWSAQPTSSAETVPNSPPS